MTTSSEHFKTDGGGTPTAAGRFVDVQAINDQLAQQYPINDYYERSILPIRLIEQRRLDIIREMAGDTSGLDVAEIRIIQSSPQTWSRRDDDGFDHRCDALTRARRTCRTLGATTSRPER